MTQSDGLIVSVAIIFIVIFLIAVCLSSKKEKSQPKKKLPEKVEERPKTTFESHLAFSKKLSKFVERRESVDSYLFSTVELYVFKKTDSQLSEAQSQFIHDLVRSLLNDSKSINTKVGNVSLDTLHKIYFDALTKELKATGLTFEISPNLDSITYKYTSISVSEEIQTTLKKYKEIDEAMTKHVEDYKKLMG